MKKARHLEEEELIKVGQNGDFDKVYEAGKNPETELDEDLADEIETAPDDMVKMLVNMSFEETRKKAM